MLIFLCPLFQEITEQALDLVRSEGIELEKRGCLLKHIAHPEELARIRVPFPERRELNQSPLPPEVEFEKRKVQSCLCGKGAVYSGYHYALLLRQSLSEKEQNINLRPVVIFPEYIASWQSEDCRWHLRYAVFSFPVLISVRGLVEAPARPRAYYVLKAAGVEEEDMPEEIKKKYLTMDHPDLPRALAATILKAWFFYETGEPFCQDPDCCLFDAHWQEQLLRSVSPESYFLCLYHKRELERCLHRW